MISLKSLPKRFFFQLHFLPQSHKLTLFSFVSHPICYPGDDVRKTIDTTADRGGKEAKISRIAPENGRKEGAERGGGCQGAHRF